MSCKVDQLSQVSSGLAGKLRVLKFARKAANLLCDRNTERVNISPDLSGGLENSIISRYTKKSIDITSRNALLEKFNLTMEISGTQITR